MLEERSAGAVVFRLEGETPLYLLLKYPAGHWDFPKGNIERGEQEEATVIREIGEETGIREVRLIPGFREKIEYHYRREEGLVHKVVYFYLAQAYTDRVTLSYEHQDYVWLPYEEAFKRVTYANAKRILESAHRFLKESAKVSSSLDEFF
jgi:8-oxo-dGTP pyrophosphatase MutT (NUDIX family)